MKRIDSEFNATLPPVTLYVEDLESAVQRIQAASLDVEFERGGFAYSDLQELRAAISLPYLSNITIHAIDRNLHFRQVSVYVEPTEVRVRADPKLKNLAAGLAHELRGHSPWYSWYPPGSHWWFGVEGAAFVVLLVTVLIIFPNEILGSRALALAAGTVSVVVIYFLGLSSRVLIGGSRVYLLPRDRTLSFWIRNRDAILVSLITSFLSLVLGVIIGRLSR